MNLPEGNVKKVLCTLIAILVAVVLPALSLAIQGAGKLSGHIVVAGTGDSQDLMKALARHFEAIHPGTEVEIPDSVGSSGGIKLAALGRADLGRVARAIHDREKKYGLEYRLFAYSPVVFSVNRSVKGELDLSHEAIVGIYRGEITDWNRVGSDHRGRIYPIHREAGDSSRSLLESRITEFSSIKNSPAKVFHTTPDTIEALVSHKDTIGYTSLAMAGSPELKIAKVNGIYPSADNIKKGIYELLVPFGIVYRKEIKPLAGAFLDFLFSADAKKIIARFGCVPAELKN